MTGNGSRITKGVTWSSPWCRRGWRGGGAASESRRRGCSGGFLERRERRRGAEVLVEDTGAGGVLRYVLARRGREAGDGDDGGELAPVNLGFVEGKEKY